ncbi:hypothetical protein [Candidatus Pelagibacter sp. HIMB1782]|uniref:hypothetical protein n=1 Tax=Candidatus Pelagibacter sp. HIMB1782 TaxID=3413375 RepID=UPI003F845FF2
MKRGHYADVYIVKEGKYFFNGDTGGCPIKVNSPTLNRPHVPRKRNRGNHFTSTNPRYSNQLRQHNEMKMLAKLKHNVDPEVQDLIPEAVELAKQKKRERLQKQLNTPIVRPYSNGIENMSKTHIQTLGLEPISSQPRGTIPFKTDYKELFPQPKNEYDSYLEENDVQPTRKLYW